MLEETGLDYAIHPVNIGVGDQFQPEFLQISPNNKIPAIVDENGPDGSRFSLSESGAILLYLAEKSGCFLPKTKLEHHETMQWLMFQMGHIGPMLGQAHHFRFYATVRQSYPIERYTLEAQRLYGVLDARLSESENLAGQDYGVADMATFPWLRSHSSQGIDLNEFPSVKRWYEAIDSRPAVKRGVQVLTKERAQPVDEKTTQENLFGSAQFKRR